MYVPEHFAMDDAGMIADFIQANNFAILSGVDSDGELIASHLPFMYDAGRGAHGTLIAHMARANPQWQGFAAETEVMVIFHGPHAYVSPSWYAHAPALPSWNYIAVHAYGRPVLIEDEAEKRTMFERMVTEHEAGFDTPWKLEEPEDYLVKMSRATVAFEIEVSRFDAKAKLSQNRKDDDLSGQVRALRQSTDTAALRLADATETWAQNGAKG